MKIITRATKKSLLKDIFDEQKLNIVDFHKNRDMDIFEMRVNIGVCMARKIGGMKAVDELNKKVNEFIKENGELEDNREKEV